MLQDAKNELYEETIGSLGYGFSKDYAYEEFRAGKSLLNEEIEQDVQDEVDEKIREWK
jgi:hypothetical protein